MFYDEAALCAVYYNAFTALCAIYYNTFTADHEEGNDDRERP
jgi:hypothetical protein